VELSRQRIYLDHAATSWPKLPSAVEAAGAYIRDCGATAGRGAYQSAVSASRRVTDARHALARLINAADGSCMALCHSGTHALNAGIRGLLNSGEHVITTAIEHNSVLRPLAAEQRTGVIEVSHVGSDLGGVADVVAARCLLRNNTRLIVVGHASNVTGAVADLAPWSELARASGARLLVDASQTLGYLPIDVQRQGIDILAAAGHKGLRALAGTGLLYVSPELQRKIKPIMWGGTGISSELLEAGSQWPHSVEVGNLNIPGIISMGIAAEEISATSTAYHAWQLPFERLVNGLQEIAAVQLVGYPEHFSHRRVPLVSLRMTGWDVHDLASVLDSQFGIEARSGLHCAAFIHDALGTSDGGTLRLSTGHSTSSAEVDQTLAAFRELGGIV
jgi:cysteine desulfurase / selenocysteine lyase